VLTGRCVTLIAHIAALPLMDSIGSAA